MIIQTILEGLGLRALLVLICAVGIRKSAVGTKEEYDDLVEKIYQLKDEKDRLLKEKASQKVHEKNLTAIEKFIRNHDVEELEFEDKLVRQFIEEITVVEEGLEFHFKTGAKVSVKE